MNNTRRRKDDQPSKAKYFAEPDSEGWQEVTDPSSMVFRVKLTPKTWQSILDCYEPGGNKAAAPALMAKAWDKAKRAIRLYLSDRKIAHPVMWACRERDIWGVLRFTRPLTDDDRTKVRDIMPAYEWVDRFPSSAVKSDLHQITMLDAEAGGYSDVSEIDTPQQVQGKEDQKPDTTLAGCLAWVRARPQREKFRYNEFTGAIEVNREPITDAVVITLREQFQLESKFPWSTQMMWDVATRIAHEQPYDPVKDYLKECARKWDGKIRVASSSFGLTYLNTPVYHWFIYRWMISLVARQFKPGCHADLTLILQGGQGIGKDRFLRTLMPNPDWYLESIDIEGTGGHSPQQMMQGRCAANFAEMATLSKREVNSVKQFLTQNVDEWRKPYERAITRAPRRCVFVGSSNEDQPLRDITGNRRFAMIKMGGRIPESCFAQLIADRDQLWGEVVHAYQRGEQWTLNEIEYAMQSHTNEDLVSTDPVIDMAMEWAANAQVPFTQSDCLTAIGIRPEMQKRYSMMLAPALRKAGYQSDRKMVHGVRVVRWSHPNIANTDLDLEVN